MTLWTDPDEANLESAALLLLDAKIADAAIPYSGVSLSGIDYLPEATAEQRAAGDLIFASFDWTAQKAAIRATTDAQALDLSDFRAKYQARLTPIDTDLAALAAATNAEVKQILGRLLQAERAELKALRAIVRG